MWRPTGVRVDGVLSHRIRVVRWHPGAPGMRARSCCAFGPAERIHKQSQVKSQKLSAVHPPLVQGQKTKISARVPPSLSAGGPHGTGRNCQEIGGECHRNKVGNMTESANLGYLCECREDMGRGALQIATRKHPEITDTPPRGCLLYTSPSPRDRQKSRMPSSA